MSEQTSAINNCLQIIMAMKIWAADEKGVFPDAKLPATATVNDVFRTLIRDEIIHDERIFGARLTPFKPDGQIGAAPNFAQALQPGENHWMMMAGLNNDSLATNAPFVFENTLNPAWPLTWRMDKQKQPVRGRTWLGDKIIIGRLDHTVTLEKLVREKGALTLPAKLRHAVEQDMKAPIRILDIEEKK
ncbi:hypothetical protein [Brevifollis gellanilyticus]|nr:hypothetical protein [Brevifollis gellanilyticus]